MYIKNICTNIRTAALTLTLNVTLANWACSLPAVMWR